MNKKVLIVLIVALIVFGFGWLAWTTLTGKTQKCTLPPPEGEYQLHSVTHGTVLRLADLSIGVSVEDDSATLFLNQENGVSEKKVVKICDQLKFGDYNFRVSEIGQNTSLNIASGSSNAFVELIVIK